MTASTFSDLKAASRALCDEVAPMRFAAPVTHVYNPLEYARAVHEDYLRLVASAPKRAIFLGMNPGPWGMAQTGVPFGEVAMVRDWMGLRGQVDKPAHEHPKRPVSGLDCTRSEVSGRRLWGAIAQHFGTPERFFARYAVANYCPLSFMEASGVNRTPDKLSAGERLPLYAACDRHVLRIVEILQPEWVIGVGGFAEDRARLALSGTGVKIGRILHPSPASPAANRGWDQAVANELTAMGLCPMVE
jgi:single-strand selective monofunctional uracil DNA glycosylase